MTMSRKRWIVVGLIVLAMVAIEVGARWARRPTAGLLLVNGGTEPIRNLSITYGGVHVFLGDVEPGAMKLVRVEITPRDAVVINFEQAGNAAPGAQVDGAELDQARREGLRMALTFQPGQVVRFMEEDDRPDDSPLGRFWRWLHDALFATPSTPRNGPAFRGWLW